MPNISLIPSKNTYVSCLKPNDNFAQSGVLYAGVGLDGSIFRSLISFDFFLLPEDIELDRAVLYLYGYFSGVKSISGFFTPYIITSNWDENEATWHNQPGINTSIAGNTTEILNQGWYGFDITRITQVWLHDLAKNFGLMIKSVEDKKGDVKKFHSQRSFYYRQYRPYLEVKYSSKKGFSLTSRNSTSNCEVYKIDSNLLFSKWQNTSFFSMYTFFVQNVGNHPAKAFVHISPDRSAVVCEAACYLIEPGAVEAIVPQKYGFFSRLALMSVYPGSKTALKVWFQAQV